MKDYYLIGHLEIPQNELLKIPLWNLDQNNDHDSSTTFIFKILKKLTNYTYDNTHLKWSNIYGQLFSLSVHYQDNQRTKEEYWEINLWDHSGSITLITLNQKLESKFSDTISEENYKQLKIVSEDFVRGKINCSDCGTKINISEIGGSYFAGRYCKDCWERKWKAIEAKETYN